LTTTRQLGKSQDQTKILSQTYEHEIAEIRRLRDDLVQGYEALQHERFGVLTERQRKRLNEIRLAVNYVSHAVDSFALAYEMPEVDRVYDPRYRLMYAARTPLEMILTGTYLLSIYHLRGAEVFAADQRECVWLMERSGRRMVVEIERLWADLLADQANE
jgi:hypothetical protein